MHSRLVFGAPLAVLLAVQPVHASDESDFCSALQQAGLARGWFSHSFFYRALDGAPVLLNSYDELSKTRVDTLYYYINSNSSERRNKSVLNLKFVFKSGRTVRRKDTVDLRNDLWRGLSEKRQTRIANDCAHVNVDGYDRFHLNNSRDYCLQYHFHQRAPNFETLATVQRQESFAFGDMIGGPRPGLADLLVSLVSPRSAQAAAAESEFSTAPYSLARSWIQNFRFGEQADQCVAIHPNFPQDAEFVHIKVNYLGISVNDQVVSRNWHLKLSK